MPRRLRDVAPPRRRRSTQVNSFATDDLKKLFLFRPHTASDLHDELQCPVCTGKIAAKKDKSKRGGANVLSAKAAARCGRGRVVLLVRPCLLGARRSLLAAVTFTAAAATPTAAAPAAE